MLLHPPPPSGVYKIFSSFILRRKLCRLRTAFSIPHRHKQIWRKFSIYRSELHHIFNQSNWKSWTFLFKVNIGKSSSFLSDASSFRFSFFLFFLFNIKKGEKKIEEDENLFDRKLLLYEKNKFLFAIILVRCHNVIKGIMMVKETIGNKSRNNTSIYIL